MKLKKFTCAITALAMAAAFGLAACNGQQGDKDGDHTHSYTMKSSETQHWEACSCGEEKADSRGAHVDEDGNGECDVCGYGMGESHGHVWAWKYEGDYHWQECTCGEEKTGSRGLHSDDNKDGECDVCKAPVKTEDGGGSGSGDEHTHSYVWMRDGAQHWQECSCGETTAKTPHTQNANYRCACGYAFDAPAENGLSSTNYWIIGTFTDNKDGGTTGWGETHSDQWKFHRLIGKDTEGRTQYVFERAFKGGEEFKIVKDGGGYWDGEINADHVSANAKKLFDGNDGGNIRVVGGAGYYVITLHAGSGTPSVDAGLLYGEGSKPQPHEHEYSSAWESDESGHWHPSICQHTGLKQDEAAHTFQNGSYTCSVCGYTKQHTHVGGEWVNNASSHWKNCTLCGRMMQETEAPHSGVPCSVCGYNVAVSGALEYEYDEASRSYFVTGYVYDEIEEELRIPAEYNNKKVTKIAGQAFMGCNKIRTVIIPDSVTCIDVYAFYNCAYLASVSLGAGVKEIGMSAFGNCSALSSIAFPASLTKIGNSAFENTAITEFTVGKNLVEIGAFAFRTKDLHAVTFEVTAGWKVRNLPFSEESEDVNVSDPVTNAKKMSVAFFQDNVNGRANYTWTRG